jgi:hypothetical protein
MEQRRLRLGDILDDYCPRERRVTNHAVVAMIEENVKQTRCTTCDAEHAYKGARVPKRRKKETPAALYKEVLAGMTDVEEAPLLAAALPAVAVATALPSVPAAVLAVRVDAPVQRASIEEASSPAAAPQIVTDRSPAVPLSEIAVASADVVDAPDEASAVVDGPVHRALIRATLPRVEGQKEVRTPPDFTARHIPARGAGHGGFRGDRDRMRMRGGSGGAGNGNSPGNAYGHGNGNANRSPGAPRFQGNRPSGQGRPSMGGRTGGGPGFRNGNGSGNGNKRGRGSRG